MTESGQRPAGGWRRRRAAVTAAVATAILATGCGVQSMEVPVDAGPAPSRASCVPPGEGGGTDVYLVCGSQVEAVSRNVAGEADADDPEAIAGDLLSELQAPPSESERDAGFSSSVPGELRISSPADGDPAGLLRLNQHPDDLPAFALVQVICTLARSPAADGADGVLLSGPAGEAGSEPRRYQCAEALRHHPDGPGAPGRSS